MSALDAGRLEHTQAAARPASAPRRRPFDWHAAVVHLLLIACVGVIAFPLYYAFIISTQRRGMSAPSRS